METSLIIQENIKRNYIPVFNPLTGAGAPLLRHKLEIPDFFLPEQYVPAAMLDVPLVKKIQHDGSIRDFIEKSLHVTYSEEDRAKVAEMLIRVRSRYDYPFYAYSFQHIKSKQGADMHFKLNRPQRRLIERLETMRLNGQPMRIVLLKARQWGGSTAVQMYIAYLQLVIRVGWNSLTVGHEGTSSAEVNSMYTNMLELYPTRLLHPIGEAYAENEPKLVGVPGTQNLKRIPQRNCKVKIGTAERPNSARGGDSSLVHCTEVAFWKKTEGKTPEQIVRSATSGVLYQPDTLIVYESTANGTGNFFQREYDDAKHGRSQFEAIFVPWYEIDWNVLPIDKAIDTSNPNDATYQFAEWLYLNRNNENVNNLREEPGKYLWSLWEKGATLENINWYITERKKYTDHGDCAAECPTDDVEAFVHSGARVFDRYHVEDFRSACHPPKEIGDITAAERKGKQAFTGLHFTADMQGQFWVWEHPEKDLPDETVTNRYLVVVDIGGRSNKADWSVIVVFDRYWMLEGGKPVVVAQWYGHIDMDLLAWKAAQIAAYYNNALLVIESNTLETKSRDRIVDGNQAPFILNEIKEYYDNLYARPQSEQDIAERKPVRYGFHTNTATKPLVIAMLVEAIREKLYVERDERCLDEYLTYERTQNGGFEAIVGYHDDLLMTRAIGLYVCFKRMDAPMIVSAKTKAATHKTVISEATL